MFAISLFILFLVMPVIVHLLAVVFRVNRFDRENLTIGSGAFSWTIAIFLGLALIIGNSTSFDERSELEAFYFDTASTYQNVASLTNEITIPAAEAGLFDIAHNNQASTTSERLRELRDKVEWYNKQLQKSRNCNDNFFLSGFCVEISDELKPIRIAK